MLSSVAVAWYQLSFNRVKLVVASAGVIVAVMLMLVQLGIREGAMNSTLAVARRVTADLVVLSPRTKTMFQSNPFPRRLLYRLPAHPGVEEVQPLYIGGAKFRNPWTHREFPITVYGMASSQPLMNFPGFSARATELELPDRVVFDGLGRTSFGPVVAHLHEHGTLETEVNYRRVQVIDAINVGISMSTDGNLYTSSPNFQRLFPARDPGAIDLGLVRLKPGQDAALVCAELQPYLGSEAVVVTRGELANREEQYMRESHPLDFIFGMGAAVGFFIGFVVVYQILYSEVVNHLPHFATLKAMGFTNGYLLRIVGSQAIMLSVFGYIPGFLLAFALLTFASKVIQMPMTTTWNRSLLVFVLTMMMCGLSALIAVRKARTADPADVF